MIFRTLETGSNFYDTRFVRSGRVPVGELIIAKSMSKEPGEYTNLVPQAIAAKQLAAEGGTVHAGQQIRYVLTPDTSSTRDYSALPAELVDDGHVYQAEKYVELLVRSAGNLFLPLGYDTESLLGCNLH